MVYRVNYSLSETRQIQERLEMTRCLQPAPQLCNAWIDCSPVVEFCVQKTRLWHHQQPRLAVSHSWCIFVACSKRPRIFSPVQVVVMLLLRKKHTWKKKVLVDHWRDWTITDVSYILSIDNRVIIKPRGTWKDADQGGQHRIQFITPIASVAHNYDVYVCTLLSIN